MGNTQNEFGKDRPDLAAVKEMRREHPSGWMELAKDPARALLIDTLLDSPPGYEFTPSEISPRAGISDQSVRNHIDILVDRGILDQIGNSEYKLNDKSRIFVELEGLNSAVNAVRSGMASIETNYIDPDKMMDNATQDSVNNEPFEGLPQNVPGAINAD